MSDSKMTKNLVIYMFRTFIVAVCPLIIFPYASRILGDEGIGKVQFIQSIATYFQLFATFGIASYGIREGAKIRDDYESLGKLVSELVVLNCITTTLSLVVYFFLFKLDRFENYHSIMIVFAFYIFFYGMNLDWFFNVTEEYAFITIRTTIFQVLSIAIMFLLLRDRSDVVPYAIVLVFPYIGSFFVNVSGIRKQINLFSGYRLEIAKHILPLILMFSIIVSSSIYSLLDTTMLGIMRGDSEVGLYSAASKLTRLIVQLTTAMCTVFVPRLSYYLGNKKRNLYQNLATQSSNIISIIAIPCAVGLFMFSKQAILLYSGKEFLAADMAMKILAINFFFSAMDGFLGWQILVPNNKDKILFIATIVGAASDFILNILWIPKWGVSGAALATLVAEFSVFIICVLNARKIISLRPTFIHCLKCLIASIPIVIIGIILNADGKATIMDLVIAVPVSAVIYLIILVIEKEKIVTEIIKYVKIKLRIY